MLNVEENRTVGTILERFRATDLDSGRNAEIEYFLDNPSSEFFRVDSKDGTLYTKVSFDREFEQNYRLQVFAKDHGSPTALTSTATVEIDITDLNDNSPEFVGLDNENSYKFRIAENEPANSHVGILLGMDNDAKDNARLKFRLVTSSGSFKLDSNTGELTTLHSLDREKQAQYELIAMLMDHGSPTRSATAKVVVYVSDVNDHDPIVVFPANGRGNVTVSFREPPGEVVARIEARDPDEGQNALLHYSLVGGNRNSIFRLGSTSAELIINHQLSEADVDIYPLEVLVQDAGIPPRSAQVKMTVKVTDSPARVYPHRLTNIQQKMKDAANQQSGDSLPSVGHFRHSEGIHSNQNSLDQRQAELPGSDNGLVSAGAILVAIVALSCAIILVLLGITVYLCGHKGLGILRRREHNSTRQAGSGNGSSLNVNTITAISNNELTNSFIDPMKRGKQTTKEMESERLNTAQMNYSDPILIDPGNGTLLRYQFGTVQGVSEPNENDYADQKLLCMNSPISYEAYTTCLPMNERVPISGTYEAIPAGRFLFPITSGRFEGKNGTKVMVNNGEVLHPKFTTDSLIKPKFRQTARNIIQTGKREKKPKRSYCDDRRFTQSLKLKRSDWINVSDSPVSEGSGTAVGEHKSASLVQPRAAKSWETLVVVNTRPRVEFVPESLGANKRVQESNDNAISSFTEPFTSESVSKASWTAVINPGASVQQPSVSTFLRDKSHVCCTPRRNPPGSSYSSNPATANSLTGTVNRFPLTEVHQDPCGYSRLCRSTQLAACSLHSPNPTGLNTATESSFSQQGTHMRRQTIEMSSRKRSTKSDNLIELTDSSQASTCSQSCECALSSTEHQCPSMQPFTVLPPYTEQSEFV
ncbi:Protocadherin-9 [Fasciola gigantica]|uniref:Protocadherin-9 n=1 Tax=Fasciola gigantica TaxID=46835 RepID=A0A504Z4J7_FASGI|nr:Protocadherin-9 [Fasciola gigantica]